MGLRYAPFCFTERGIAMLSSVLNSKKAIQVNIQIIRIFTKMREFLSNQTELLLKMEQFEKALLSQNNIKINSTKTLNPYSTHSNNCLKKTQNPENASDLNRISY